MSKLYRTEDQDLLSSTKEFLIRHAKDPQLCWKAIRRYLYLDDLHRHAIAVARGESIEWGYGNLLAKLILVFPSLGNANRIAFFKRIISPMDLDFNQIYITSYQKGSALDSPNSIRLLSKEIEAILPSAVVCFGDMPVPSGSFKTIAFPDAEIEYLQLLMKENDKGIRPSEDPELKRAKSKFWIQIRNIIPFFEN